MATWTSDHDPTPAKISFVGWLRVVLRGAPLGVVVFGGLVILLVLRLIERPLFGLRRPWTPYITRFVCRMAFVLLGLGFRVHGQVMTGPGAIVANHSSWLDIFALNARASIYFVSKSEVAGWPGIGWLARATGTVFIARQAREAKRQAQVFAARLGAGHKLVFFPEGTSTDGQRVLPFKSTLFAAFYAPELPKEIAIQPVSVRYHAPGGADARFYGWWGDMDFGPHLLQTLAARRQGSVEVTYHPPIAVRDVADRKRLAQLSEQAVRDGMRLTS